MTTSTTTSNTVRTSTKKFAFTFDHINKKIVGKDVDFQKAGIPGSDLEKELNARMEDRPSYGFTIIPTEKKPAKKTYAGLTRELMREYIEVQEIKAKDDLLAQLDTMIKDKIAYPTIKSWFLEEFNGFNVNKAKTLIKAKKLIAVKAKVRLVKANSASKSNITEFNPSTQTAEKPLAVNL